MSTSSQKRAARMLQRAEPEFAKYTDALREVLAREERAPGHIRNLLHEDVARRRAEKAEATADSQTAPTQEHR